MLSGSDFSKIWGIDMEGKTPDKYLILKSPSYLVYHYCRDTGCIALPVALNMSLEGSVVPYFAGFQYSQEQYERLKEEGLILHETDDIETAQMIAQDFMDRLFNEVDEEGQD